MHSYAISGLQRLFRNRRDKIRTPLTSAKKNLANGVIVQHSHVIKHTNESPSLLIIYLLHLKVLHDFYVPVLSRSMICQSFEGAVHQWHGAENACLLHAA